MGCAWGDQRAVREAAPADSTASTTTRGRGYRLDAQGVARCSGNQRVDALVDAAFAEEKTLGASSSTKRPPPTAPRVRPSSAPANVEAPLARVPRGLHRVELRISRGGAVAGAGAASRPVPTPLEGAAHGAARGPPAGPHGALAAERCAGTWSGARWRIGAHLRLRALRGRGRGRALSNKPGTKTCHAAVGHTGVFFFLGAPPDGRAPDHPSHDKSSTPRAAAAADGQERERTVDDAQQEHPGHHEPHSQSLYAKEVHPCHRMKTLHFARPGTKAYTQIEWSMQTRRRHGGTFSKGSVSERQHALLHVGVHAYASARVGGTEEGAECQASAALRFPRLSGAIGHGSRAVPFRAAWNGCAACRRPHGDSRRWRPRR